MGANISKSSSEILSSLKASIESSQKSMINTSTNVLCSNVQEVVGSQGCSINFAEQSCELDAVTKSLSNMSILNNVSQDVLQSLKNSSTAESSGLPVGLNHSQSSAVVKSMMDVAQISAQNLGTNCSRDASAVNVQSFRDSSCTEKNIINFAAQKTSLKLMSECVVEQSASNVATQKVTSLIDNSSSATSKGLDLFAFFGIFILFLMVLLFFPLLKRFITGIIPSPSAKPPNFSSQIMQDLDGRRASKQKVAYLLLGLIVMVLLIWPGLFAGMSGIWPWPSKLPRFDGQQTCKVDDEGNGFVAESNVINKFGFFDPMCTTGDKAQQECKTIVSYKECGIFSGKCDDPEYVSARKDFDAATKACGPLSNSPFTYCRSQDISNKMFAKEYPECKRCENDGNNPLWHSFVAKDKDCDPTKVNLLMYMNDQCDGGDEINYCKTSKEGLTNVSPNDCLDPGYQLRKKQLSKYLRACEEVKKTSRVKSEVILANCPPPRNKYFTKCSEETSKCSYIANGCVCDSTGKNCDCRNADQEAVGACRNDFTNCLDPDYLMDVKFHSSINAKCAQVRKEESSANFVWPVLCGGIYFIMIVAMIYFAYSGFKPASTEVQKAIDVQQSMLKVSADAKTPVLSSKRYKFLFVLLLVLFFLFIPPVGCIAVAERMPPIWDEKKIKTYTGLFDGVEKIDVTALKIIGYIGAAFCVVGMIFCLFKIFKLKKTEQTS